MGNTNKYNKCINVETIRDNKSNIEKFSRFIYFKFN